MIVEDVLREMEMTASVHHPGLVKFFGVVKNGSESDVPVGYVMEYFPGEQLEKMLDELNPES